MIYHTEAIERGTHRDVVDLMRVAERRINTFVLNPALVITLGAGTALAILTRADVQPWFHVKLLFLLGLIAFHSWCWRTTRQLAIGNIRYSSRQLRLLNEVPFFVLVGIVFSAVSRRPDLGPRAVAVLIGVVGLTSIVMRIKKRWS